MKPDLETVEESKMNKFGLWAKFPDVNSVRIRNLQLEIVNTKSLVKCGGASTPSALQPQRVGRTNLPTEDDFYLWCRWKLRGFVASSHSDWPSAACSDPGCRSLISIGTGEVRDFDDKLAPMLFVVARKDSDRSNLKRS